MEQPNRPDNTEQSATPAECRPDAESDEVDETWECVGGTCNEGHAYIVYQGPECPLCAANKEIDKMEATISRLDARIQFLEGELS